MPLNQGNVLDAAINVLTTSDAEQKAAVALAATTAWQERKLDLAPANKAVPAIPARPARPELIDSYSMPKRGLGSDKGRIAMLHAVAHIELNAIDLAFDMVARFTGEVPVTDRQAFVNDWMSVGKDEARHFLMLDQRLNDYGATYGDLPAHNGLWEAATRTSDCIMARLAIAPLVLEARGLDVTPQMIKRLTAAGDLKSAQILETIYEEEVPHVANGTKWFRYFCTLEKCDPIVRFQEFVQKRFKGSLKKPFNHPARAKAGLERQFYESLAG